LFNGLQGDREEHEIMAIETPARIAVLGAGPIGLEAALYARYLGYDVDVYERGRVAENVLAWGHLRMFTPFGLNRSTLGLAALRAQDPGWTPPAEDAMLTGREFAATYLVPLSRSDLLADSLREQTEVVAIGRDGPLKDELAEDEARGDCQLRLLVRSTNPDDHGREEIALADAVIDATGTYSHHNWLGHGGIPAVGEMAAAAHVEYGLPDVRDADRELYASRSILLVGSGHSAATNLAALADLAAQAPDTWITWVTRGTEREPIRLVADDPFAERLRIARLANRLAADDANHVTHYGETTVGSVSWHADLQRFSVRLLGKHAGEFEFDRIVANVGWRADDSINRELSAGAQYPAESGSRSLLRAEPDFYVLGAKSYGRDSRFLIRDGLAQIRDLFTIIGDRADLDLYATMKGLY
jgi:thioredoxin reductase